MDSRLQTGYRVEDSGRVSYLADESAIGKIPGRTIAMNSIISGRCYCGETKLLSTKAPKSVVYCHCTDCRRVTGAPVAAFAAFDEAVLSFEPGEGRSVSVNPGVVRTFCELCGTPLTGRYDYLPGTVYVAVGVLDQADDLAPQLHAHESNRLSWLPIDNKCKRIAASARDELNMFGNEST